MKAQFTRLTQAMVGHVGRVAADARRHDLSVLRRRLHLTVHAQDGDIVRVTSRLDHDVTSDQLCIKGRFGWQFVQQRDKN